MRAIPHVLHLRVVFRREAVGLQDAVDFLERPSVEGHGCLGSEDHLRGPGDLGVQREDGEEPPEALHVSCLKKGLAHAVDLLGAELQDAFAL